MSSPEFAGLRGISGMAVAKRCAILVTFAKRELLWWIQGLSLTEGGLKQLVQELLAMFPERINRNGARVLYEMEDFLVDLCINPRLLIGLKQEGIDTCEFDIERARHESRELEQHHFRKAGLDCFENIVGALVEYKHRYEERVRAEFCQTSISGEIWKQLDYALKSRTMIVLEGREGRGKTEAIRAWCDCHLGAARFVSLLGTNTKTAHFGELAHALGVGHGGGHKVSQMQANVEEVLQASHLMLVIDEAHFFFNQAPRMKTRPEMLDWLDTALCNPPLPLALVTTPQFMVCMERAAGQVEWNYRQFKRRCKRYWRLPAKNSAEDVERVARHLLPGADKATIKQILAYEALSKRDLSAVGDVVREASLLAKEEGARKVTFEHVKRAIHEILFLSDLPWAEMERRLQNRGHGRKARREAPALAVEPFQEPAETQEREIPPRLLPGASNVRQMRFGEPQEPLIIDPDAASLNPA